jgi:putative transposase
MPNYRRAFIPGGSWFFTVNLLQRHHNDLLIREISLLRETVRRVRERRPFQIDAWVVLPEHLYSTAWMPPLKGGPPQGGLWVWTEVRPYGYGR